MTQQAEHLPSDGFWRSEAGAVTIDWVVLSAVALSIGLSGMTAVRTGTLTLSEGINLTLSSGAFWGDTFEFEHLTEQEQHDSATSYAAMSDAELTGLATRQSDQFAQRIETDDLDGAARLIEQQQLLSTTMDSRNVPLARGTLTVADMTESLGAARGS